MLKSMGYLKLMKIITFSGTAHYRHNAVSCRVLQIERLRRKSEICCVRFHKALNFESVGRPGVNTVGFFILTKTS